MEEQIVRDRRAGTNLTGSRSDDTGWTVVPLQLSEGVVGDICATDARHCDALISTLCRRQGLVDTQDTESAGESWQHVFKPGDRRYGSYGPPSQARIDQLIYGLIPGLAGLRILDIVQVHDVALREQVAREAADIADFNGQSLSYFPGIRNVDVVVVWSGERAIE